MAHGGRGREFIREISHTGPDPMIKSSTMVVAVAIVCMSPVETCAQRQMEKLGRGLVAVNRGDGKVFVGWRLLGTDPDGIAFNVYRVTDRGKPVRLNDRPVASSTNFVDAKADLKKSNAWFTRSILNGRERAASARFTLKGGAPARQRCAPLPSVAGGRRNFRRRHRA